MKKDTVTIPVYFTILDEGNRIISPSMFGYTIFYRIIQEYLRQYYFLKLPVFKLDVSFTLEEFYEYMNNGFTSRYGDSNGKSIHYVVSEKSMEDAYELRKLYVEDQVEYIKNAIYTLNDNNINRNNIVAYGGLSATLMEFFNGILVKKLSDAVSDRVSFAVSTDNEIIEYYISMVDNSIRKNGYVYLTYDQITQISESSSDYYTYFAEILEVIIPIIANLRLMSKYSYDNEFMRKFLDMIEYGILFPVLVIATFGDGAGFTDDSYDESCNRYGKSNIDKVLKYLNESPYYNLSVEGGNETYITIDDYVSYNYLIYYLIVINNFSEYFKNYGKDWMIW